MEQIPKISVAVYVYMCRIIGTPTLVSVRREVADITEIIRTPVEESVGSRSILSGSCREGFGPVASDKDFMGWRTDHHVIWDLNHADKYHTERCTLILMECSEDHPGFAMLQLLTPSDFAYVRLSCVRINDGLYISSAKYRENTLSLFQQGSTQHGPCANGRHGTMEYDLAHCFACKLWPSVASTFALRCQSKNWPPNHVLRDIINSGCHVVPIGLKGSQGEDCEWRISFSIAEQKLVYCMNHTQFMCYGLLKLSLKEVLFVEDGNGQPLLCSYFMKTVLFWVIQQSNFIDWNPSNLLTGFWLCLKFLLSCVYHGNLPNFFIPENNIFISKVVGYSRQLLYQRLLEMYNLGIACLLHCHAVRDCFIQAICIRQYVLSTAESDIISEFSIDCELFNEIVMHNNSRTSCSNAEHCFVNLYFALRYLHAHTPNLSLIERVTLRKCISSILRCNVFHLYNTSDKLYNKGRLRIMYACLNLLKVSVKMGCFSDRIYMVLFMYSMGKKMDAIKYLMELKTIIVQPYIMYSGTVNQQRYSDEVGALPLSEKMRRAVTMNINLPRLIVKELELEFRVIRYSVYVPPYGNPRKQREALYELYVLLRYDEGRYISSISRDISWQILGICQQICGDHHGALLSYQNSLKQIPFHYIQEATHYRMQDAQYRILTS